MSANGQLSPAELAPIGGGFFLRNDVAEAFLAMSAESVRRFGAPIRVRDAYRPLGHPGDHARGIWSQWAAWEIYRAGGNLAADPRNGGTSNHGWGTAIDLQSLADRQRLDKIGAAFGFAKSWSDAPSEWWHIKWVPGHFRPHPSFVVMHPGMSGLRILGMTSRLRDCGWLPRAYFRWPAFNAKLKSSAGQARQIHGAVVAFQKRHHLAPDGVVGPITDKTLTFTANACKRTKHKEN